MKIAMLTAEDVNARSAAILGLDADTTDIFSVAGVSALLRRAASFLCPASPRQLVDAVLDVLTPVAPNSVSRDDLKDHLDELVAAGDLIELAGQSERQARLLFLGPPSYVIRSPGRYLLLGVRPFGALLLTDELAEHIRYEGHLRTLSTEEPGAESLAAAGLYELEREDWIGAPRAQTADELLGMYRQRLENTGWTGAIEGLVIIDPAARVDYYRGRLRPPNASDSGEFVGRRPQAYGADRWCFVRITKGQPQALIDLPAEDPAVPARFEAWHIQAALDAERGHQQVLRVRPAAPDAPDERVIDLFGPVPGWAERYLTLVGWPADRERGALLSYRLPSAAVTEASSFLAGMLWIRIMDEGTSK